jgi:hypothetical protein
MDHIFFLIKVRVICEKLVAEILPRFGRGAAESHDEAFEIMLEEHLLWRDETTAALERWAEHPTVTNEKEEVFSQCFLRLTGAIHFAQDVLDGRRDCSAAPKLTSGPAAFRFLTVDLWATDDWPREWLRIVADRQKLR